MDLNEGSTEKKDEVTNQNANSPPQEEQKSKPQFTNSKLQQLAEGKFYMPKFHMPNLKEKFAEYGRVWKVTKKPDTEEFKAIVKASGLGIVVVGMVGFIIAMIVQVIKMI